jgi:ketosteroid isomerase-like protein
MNSLVTAIALVAGLLLPPGLDGGDLVEEPFPLKQAAVAKIIHELFEAAEQGDLQRLESFHLYGPKFSKFDDMPPSARQDAAATRRQERMALSALTDFSATVEDLRVDVLGSVAVATFILRYSFETPDASGSASARSTMVLVETADTWKIVHEHFSRLRRPE